MLLAVVFNRLNSFVMWHKGIVNHLCYNCKVKSPFKLVQEVKDELKKATWSTRQETIRLTALVLIVSLIVSFYLGAADYIFGHLLKIVIQTN